MNKIISFNDKILEEFDNKFSVHKGEIDNDYIDCVMSKDIKCFISQALDRDRERIYKRISEEYTGSCGYYDDIDIKNACYDK